MSLQGTFAQSRQCLNLHPVADDSVSQPSYLQPFGQDHSVFALANQSWVLWWLGYPDQALQRGQEALRLAQQRSNPFTLAHTRIYTASVYLLRREAHLAQVQAEAAQTIAREYNFPRPEMLAVVLQGAALIMQQQETAGIALLRQGLDLPRASRNDPLRSYWLVHLAIAEGRLGQTEAALRVLDEGLDLIHTTGAYCWHALLLQLKGDLLLHADDGSQKTASMPEDCFLQALDIARQQQAMSVELRVAISLSRLWQQQGKRDKAHDLLAPLYNRFSEGFDTADLQESKLLLQKLV
jgi:adenylate cyclase